MGASGAGAAGLKEHGRRAVFLDRDGVLNRAIEKEGRPYPPTSLSALAFLSDARDSVTRLRHAGFITICVTNQPDVARGSLNAKDAKAINTFTVQSLGLDDLISCFHDDADACRCRKPKPGMLFKGSERWSIDLNRSYLIGDRWRDIDAGATAGCRTILIDRGWKERQPTHEPHSRVTSTTDAVNWIFSDSRKV